MIMQPEWITDNVPLAPYTTMRVGGPARWFAQPGTAGEVAATLDFAAKRNVPVLMLGGGSNLVVADKGVRAVVLRLRRDCEFGFVKQEANPLVWTVGAAAPLPGLLAALQERGVAGLEHMAGIPGSVGGAAAMNAGSAEQGFGEVVMQARVMDSSGKEHTWTAKELAFGYRKSALAGAGVIALGFSLLLTGLEEPEELARRARERRDMKVATQPLAFASAGCIFKNPHDTSAGKLLDEAGCKGMMEGGAEVSGLHANFIINAADATARDVAVLAARMREKVRKRFGVELEREITWWGEENV